MKLVKLFLLSLASIILFNSCGLFGIHFNVHNPKKAGKYPKFSEELILLAENTSIRKKFDVKYYNIDVAIYPEQKKLGGWVEIKSIALSDIDSIQIDLDQPLEVKDIRFQNRVGEQLKYVRKHRAIFILFNKTIKQGDSFSVHLNYEGKPIIAKQPPWSGGAVWKKDKQGKHWAGVVCESEGASVWLPCKDVTFDEPDSVDLRFTLFDSDLMVVSNGQFVGEEQKDNSKSFKWKVSYPINVYNITFYVGNYTRVEDTMLSINSNVLQLNHYVLKPNADIAKNHFKQVKEHIRIYEELYGEYPWNKDGFKLVESPYAGQEHQSGIAYGNGYKNDLYGKDDYIILHETGHEWFGNGLTADDLADVWLQEGFTTYGEALYLEKKYDEDLALNHLLAYRWGIKNKFPLVGPKDRRYFDYKDGDVYSKGAWVLHTLRNQINHDYLFFSILRTFYQENKLVTTDSKKFNETVNSITGENYDWFFNQYLYKSRVPFFEWDYASDGMLYYRWLFVSEDFNKLRIPVKFSDTGKTIYLYPSADLQRVDLSAESTSSDRIYIENDKTLFGIKRNKKLHSLFKQKDLESTNK